jgi:hypothetical protein
VKEKEEEELANGLTAGCSLVELVAHWLLHPSAASRAVFLSVDDQPINKLDNNSIASIFAKKITTEDKVASKTP